MSVSLGPVQKLTSPNPFALVTARKPDGGTNLMAISWWTYASNHPATVAICTSRRGYTGELIEATSEFGLNIVGESLREAAFACGTCSGRDVDKAKKFAVPLRPGEAIATDMVLGGAAALECRLKTSVPAGDHVLYIAEVVNLFCDPSQKPLFAVGGYSALKSF